MKSSWPGILARWLDRLQPSAAYVLGGAALLVGLTSGMGVWLFKRLIDLAHWAAFEGLAPRLELFEMTHDYRIILPLMFAVIISLLVSQRLQRDSVYTLGLARKGIRLQRGRDIDVMEALQVSDVMLDEKVTLSTGFPVVRLADMVMPRGGCVFEA